MNNSWSCVGGLVIFSVVGDIGHRGDELVVIFADLAGFKVIFKENTHIHFKRTRTDSIFIKHLPYLTAALFRSSTPLFLESPMETTVQ